MAQEMQMSPNAAAAKEEPGMSGQLRPGILAGKGVVPEPTEKIEEIDQDMSSAKEQLTPEEVAQLDAYADNATNLIFSEKTQPAILQQLQARKNPVENVAYTANHVHKILFDGLTKNGESMTDKTMFLGATHVVSELHLLAEAAGLFTLSNEEKLNAFQYTLLIYFKEGMESGKIDPVELQKELEPLMTDEQRQYGMMAMSQMDDISKTAPPSGQRWATPVGKMQPGAKPQPGQQQPQPAQRASAEIPPGLIGQGGM